MASLVTFLHLPLVRAALLGASGGFGADLHVWLGYKSWLDFKSFDFSTASFRWVCGAATGLLAALGWSVV